MLTRILTLMLVVASGWIAGCGAPDGVALHPVEGELKYNGQPLAGAQVVFHLTHATGKTPPARGQTDASGRFKLTTFVTHDGAPIGDYSVTVEYFPLVQQRDEFAAGRNVLPARYASPATTDLRLRVAEGTNKLDALEIKR